MLLLAALVATTAWSYGFSQEIPIQTPASITMSQGTARLQCHFKDVSANFDNTVIHWYQQKEKREPVRMLYISSGTTIVENSFQRNRYMVQNLSNQKICILIIKNIGPVDAATYYCAYWDPHYSRNPAKVFGSGTKLIVSEKGNSKPENSEILQTKHKDQLLYVCLIENFYPGVIRVQWVDGADKEITKNVVKGDVWKSTNDKYSISTWLTLPVNTTNKDYACKYEHESQENFKLPIQDSSKTSSQEEYCSTHSGNSTIFYKDYLMHRAAHLVYLVLLLKSSMYYVIVLFFIYRTRTPAKLPGKKT
ncbi:immunoglobulin lambda-1 light chain [Cygnus atratus]|uniref:immunoglobulin lambda-1 light chain n=1 Tax=Cygnus atratus TaxID=8868 RepID=UPI0021B75E6E|nr:immunoglobulin lambda-1 light chain [Cygnus atratus]